MYHSFCYIIWGLRIIDNVMKHFLALLSMLSDLAHQSAYEYVQMHLRPIFFLNESTKVFKEFI